MESFLAASKAALPNLSACKKVRIVLGNPTCDLDSAVCCLIQGLAEYLEMKKNKLTDHAVIPVLDIPQTEYRLKTEVAYYLDRHKLSSNLLTFRDQIDLKTLTDRISVDIVLVDHHTLAVEDAFLEEFVVKVIDHRPRDSSWPWPGRTICIETVGSCATLVAREFLRNHSDVLDARLSNLLRGPILIDTCNFSTKALRATPVDLEVMESLEKVGGFESDRTQLFEEIAAAKNDIVGLTNDDLMIKDLKITAGVPIVGLPLLVENFLGRENALGAIESFAVSRRARVVLLVGLETKSTEVARDVAVFSSDRDPLADKVTRALTTATEPSLELTASREIFHDEGRRFRLIVYKQGNLRATRKQILPIVRNTVSAECRT